MFDSIKNTFSSASERLEDAGKMLMVIEPVSPFNQKGMLTALITAAGLISTALLAGVGLTAMLVLLASLAMILLILSRVFGVEFDTPPEEFFRF